VNLGVTLCNKNTISQRSTKEALRFTETKSTVGLFGRTLRELFSRTTRMFLAKVIGTVWATRKDEHLKSFTLQCIQPISAERINFGSPIIAVDTVGAGAGETVFYITAAEAVIPLPVDMAPVDASIVGIVDRIDLQK
jgi:ethanolamine utilization protein EutN